MVMIFRSVRKGLSKSNTGLLSGLDIGSSKVSCCITRPSHDGSLKVLGVGQYASRGIRGGAIVDMQALEMAIRGAVHDAETAAGETIHEVFISLSPNLISSSVVRVEANIAGHAVDETDVRKILAQAAQSAEKPGHEIIHSISASYTIDTVQGIRDPRGMFGDALNCSVLVLSAPSGPLRNLYACIERCHLSLNGLVVSPYASGLATLVEDEIDLGATLIDLGAGSTSIAIFYDGRLTHIDHVPIGGAHVTSDLARGLSTPLAQAERIKTLYGSAMVSPSDSREMIAAPQIGEEATSRGTQVTKAELTRIIRPRIEETFELIRERLRNVEADKIAGKRLVLTGGASQLPGVRELASLILDKQGRIGRPLYLKSQNEQIKSPAFATCAGLLEFARSEHIMATAHDQDSSGHLFNRFGKLGSWLRENV
jgi:cell division protein FtsA